MVLELFWSASGAVLEHPGAVLELLNRCPSCNHHKDLESPEMGQLEHDYMRLLKRQESSFLLTLIVLIINQYHGQMGIHQRDPMEDRNHNYAHDTWHIDYKNHSTR